MIRSHVLSVLKSASSQVYCSGYCSHVLSVLKSASSLYIYLSVLAGLVDWFFYWHSFYSVFDKRMRTKRILLHAVMFMGHKHDICIWLLLSASGPISNA